METKGMDISEWQGNVDFAKAKASGIGFTMLRATYGETKTDSMFKANVTKAKAAGMPIGAYHYCYAKSQAEAIAEANNFLKAIGGIQFEYPLVLDIEDKSIAGLGKDCLTDIAYTFLETVESKGNYAMLYASLDWLQNKLDYNRLKRFDVWLAQWADKPTFGGSFGIWQYTSKGSVAGIGGNIDMDICYKDYPSGIKSSGINGFSKIVPTPTPAPAPAPTAAHKIGEQVSFNACYAASTDGADKAIPASKMARTSGKITRIIPVARNPYLLDNGLCWVNDSCIRGATAPSPAPAPRGFVKGQRVSLNNAPLFASASAASPSNHLSGTYFLYDGEEIDGKYRVTNSAANVGRQPVGNYVTGFVKKENL